jgi:hypothetical protein
MLNNIITNNKITQVQITEKAMRDEFIFVNGLCRQYVTAFLSQNFSLHYQKIGMWCAVTIT